MTYESLRGRDTHAKGRVVRLATLALAFACADAIAHDFWVEPTTFSPVSGAPVGVRLCVGDGFDGWSLARNAQRIVRFAALGASGEQAIVGLDGSEPAGFVRLTAPGDYIITYRSNDAFTRMPAAKFDEYLKDKGLNGIIALRKLQGADSRPVREAYSRHAKALLRVGGSGDEVVDRPIGLRLELVAEPRLPTERADTVYAFRLLYDGRPLAGALLTAMRPGTADAEQRVVTGDDGRARFRLHDSGLWRVASVHMIKATEPIAAEWVSLWASLTFELPARSPSATDPAPVRKAACQNRLAPSVAQVQR